MDTEKPKKKGLSKLEAMRQAVRQQNERHKSSIQKKPNDSPALMTQRVIQTPDSNTDTSVKTEPSVQVESTALFKESFHVETTFNQAETSKSKASIELKESSGKKASLSSIERSQKVSPVIDKSSVQKDSSNITTSPVELVTTLDNKETFKPVSSVNSKPLVFNDAHPNTKSSADNTRRWVTRSPSKPRGSSKFKATFNLERKYHAESARYHIEIIEELALSRVPPRSVKICMLFVELTFHKKTSFTEISRRQISIATGIKLSSLHAPLRRLKDEGFLLVEQRMAVNDNGRPSGDFEKSLYHLGPKLRPLFDRMMASRGRGGTA